MELGLDRALPLGRGSGLVLGEFEPLAFEGECRRLAGSAAQKVAGEPFDGGDPRACLIGGALRLGPCAARDVELVDEVVGAAADPFAQLGELGAQLVHRASDLAGAAGGSSLGKLAG